MTTTTAASDTTQTGTSTPSVMSPPPSTRKRGLGRGFSTLLATETKVWLRDSSIFWVAFPTLILLMNMVMESSLREVAYGEGFEFLQGHPVYGNAFIMIALPPIIAMGLGMTTVSILPVTFGGFRDKGVFKLFSASPMRPQGLFAAHAIINIVASLFGVVIMVAVTAAIAPIAMPINLAVTIMGILLGLIALLSVGSLIAAVVPKANVGTLAGNIAFFVFLFTSGAMGGSPAPGEVMYYVTRFSPMGAAAQVIQYGWIQATDFPVVQLIVLGVWTLVCAPLAVKLFRWR